MSDSNPLYGKTIYVATNPMEKDEYFSTEALATAYIKKYVVDAIRSTRYTYYIYQGVLKNYQEQLIQVVPNIYKVDEDVSDGTCEDIAFKLMTFDSTSRFAWCVKEIILDIPHVYDLHEA